ncbi:tolB protein precursor, periplasmic protein [Cystobacter fuscus DSM 2262]|uniref:TolB protein, periplasmic protein n=1 Tax=Cystobacter fuscus (strain ATCC 25194 / DSM 2262 / NBRC 100088 / M29) TaxID=1242864 RepID=S9QED0_CYSF2|nr:LpqB family beta-propeller domain-containing protein [Cystobacter fuscus]EPX59664.1 tolB protein precursor, periplasmic protein [Cystobacter fuscus DSM 2262]
MTRERVMRTGRGGARRLAVLALALAGCGTGKCGGDASAPLSLDERRALPGVIAFVSERAPQRDVWLVRPTGEESQLTRAPEDEYPAAPSPDGAAMLVVSAAEVQGLHMEQLWLVPLDGGPRVKVTEPRGRARNPSWAPDGSWLVAESDAQGFSDVVRQAPRADAEVLGLATAREGNFEPSVSPDGSRVVFVSSREGDPELYVMKADGTDVRRLTHFPREDVAPRWSPDGQWISFLSDRDGRTRLYVMKADGTELRPVSASATVGDEREPAWSPDGRRLAFVAASKDPKETKARIWVVDVAGGEPVALTRGQAVEDQPAWSPEGKHLVFASERTGDVELFLMRADGSGQTPLTTSRGADWLPRWFIPRKPLSPDAGGP